MNRKSCAGRLKLPCLFAFALLLFGLTASFSIFANVSPVIVDATGFWTQVVAEGNLSGLDSSLGKVRAWVEGQGRFNNGNPNYNMNWYQSMARAALGYGITDRLTFWTGYTYLPTQNYDKPFIGEQDVWPALRYVIPTQIGTITLREMVEVRYAGGDTPGVRPRTLVRLLHPFDFEPRLGLLVWDEAFFNANNVPSLQNLGLSGFNQNRAFVGMAWTFNQNVRTEFGYMDLIVNTSKPTDPVSHYKNLNAISASVFLSW